MFEVLQIIELFYKLYIMPIFLSILKIYFTITFEYLFSFKFVSNDNKP